MQRKVTVARTVKARPGFPASGHNAKKARRGGLTGKQYRKWRKRQVKAAAIARSRA